MSITEETLKQTFAKYVASLVAYLQVRGTIVTEDELMELFVLVEPTPAVAPVAAAPVVIAGGNCPFLITRGDRKGQPCAKKNKAGHGFCSGHVGSKGSSGAPVVAAAPGAAVLATPTRVCPVPVEVSLKDASRYLFPDTPYVISPETKVVIGKEMEDGSVAPLTEQDMAYCVERRIPLKMEDNFTTPAAAGVQPMVVAPLPAAVVPAAAGAPVTGSPKPLCPFLITRGDRKGQACARPCSKGFAFCASHKPK